jgi:hypothetical protein
MTSKTSPVPIDLIDFLCRGEGDDITFIDCRGVTNIFEGPIDEPQNLDLAARAASAKQAHAYEPGRTPRFNAILDALDYRETIPMVLIIWIFAWIRYRGGLLGPGDITGRLLAEIEKATRGLTWTPTYQPGSDVN